MSIMKLKPTEASMWTLRASLLLFAPLAFGAVEITRPLMSLQKDGVEVSRHTSEVEAMERASESPGKYVLRRPDATIVVIGDPDHIEPPPDPNDPPVTPPTSIIDGLVEGEFVKLNDVACSGPDPICTAWVGFSGFTCDDNACYGMGGGHAGTATDAIFKMDYESFQWVELYQPSTCETQNNLAAFNQQHISWTQDGHERPATAHSYDLLSLWGGYLYNSGNASFGHQPAYNVCTADWFQYQAQGSDMKAVRYSLETGEWEWLNTTWGVSQEWRGGYPGSVVVGDKLWIVGHGRADIYDYATDTRTNVATGPVGYEGAVVNGDGVIYVISNTGSSTAFGRVNGGTIEALIPEGCGISSHWGFEWDAKNHVMGAVQGGMYRFWNPVDNNCGYVPIESDIPLDVAYHASAIIGDVYLFVSTDLKTYAYRIPDVSGYVPDGYGGVAVVDGVEYKSLQAASAALTDGGKMTLSPGTYIEPFTVTANNVTVEGCGAHIQGVSIGGKGAIVNTGNGNTFDCLEISGVSVSDRNGAAIRHEGCGITLKNVNFHDNEMGFMTGYDVCTTLIDGSTFKDNGYGDGYSHNLYVNSDTFIFRNSKSLGAYIGHEIKSRSKYITIDSSVVDSEDSPDSRLIDLPCGGVIVITNNILRQGPESENPGVIGIDWESCHHAEQSLEFVGNTVTIQPNHVLFDNVGTS